MKATTTNRIVYQCKIFNSEKIDIILDVSSISSPKRIQDAERELALKFSPFPVNFLENRRRVSERRREERRG